MAGQRASAQEGTIRCLYTGRKKTKIERWGEMEQIQFIDGQIFNIFYQRGQIGSKRWWISSERGKEIHPMKENGYRTAGKTDIDRRRQ